jgi:DNA-binding CsgD family transcriptional regulator
MRLRSGTRVFPDGTRLTPRQEEVARLLSDGLTNGQIAERLGISLDGAKFHVTEVMNRFGVHTREEAAAAWREGRGRSRGLGLVGTAKAVLISAGVVAGVASVVLWVVILRGRPAGDGGSAEALEAMRLAVAQTKTAQFTILVEFQAPGEPKQSSTASGQVDFEHDRSASLLPEGGEQVWANGTQYMRLGDGKWRTFDGGAGGPVNSLSPPYWLALMEDAKDVIVFGAEEIRGGPVTHYSFTTPLLVKGQPSLTEMYKHTTFHWDVWLGEGRVVRLEQRAKYERTGTDVDGQETFQRIELSNWNEPVDIHVPGPDEIEQD